jgi:hypothetical protein
LQKKLLIAFCKGATEDAISAAREAFHMHLAKTQKSQQQHAQDTSEEDLSQLDERELEAEFAGTFFEIGLLFFVLLYMVVWPFLLISKYQIEMGYGFAMTFIVPGSDCCFVMMLSIPALIFCLFQINGSFRATFSCPITTKLY